MTLNYPLFSLPCILVSPQATVAALFVCWLPSAHRGVGARRNPQLLNQVSFSAFVNEMLVWVEAGSNSLQHNCREHFPDIEGKLKHNSKEPCLQVTCYFCWVLLSFSKALKKRSLPSCLHSLEWLLIPR